MTAAITAIAPVLLAVAVAAWVDLRTRQAGLDPPGFESPVRRWGALMLLSLFFWIVVFSAFAGVAGDAQVDFEAISDWQLFALHALMVATILGWYALGYGGGAGGGTSLAEQVGLVARRPLAEVGLGLVFGVGAWLVVLLGVVVVALILSALGGEDLLPKAPPDMIPWIAARPWWLRLAVALSAGFFEEAFFRGFLQPRVGIPLSTLLFVAAHISYDQPFMLVGVTLLSLLYALLVRWRQSIWAAATAHALFDGVQLLLVIPSVLDVWNVQGGG
ncbi:MAG: CPBP family intramembrane metalloprotease [Acidobacteria bacterium]|nr:CPBP family intramembrane metalloprotease [Acidobacteriota bacterium]